jgi:hypothetical protein
VHHTIWMWSWWIHMLGWDANTGTAPYRYGHIQPYAPWSGSVSDFGLIAASASGFTFTWAFLRKHNCHTRRCWRIGRHKVEGTEFIVCRKHHPEDKPTAEDIRRRYHLYAGKQVGRG